MDKKTLYIICEGGTDKISLYESLKNYFDTKCENIDIKITKGDIAYKDEYTSSNCVKKLEAIVKKHLDINCLWKSDILAVIQLIDTDGAFVMKTS